VHWAHPAGQHLPGFPLYWRGNWGRRAQSQIRDEKPAWQHEYHLSTEIKISPFTFTISGKIDLLYEADTEVIIEEIKTVILTGSAFKKIQIGTYPHFLEQVLIYCHIYQFSHPDKCIIPRLTIVNLLNDQVLSFDLPFDENKVKDLIHSRLKSKINILGSERKKARFKSGLVKKIPFKPDADRPHQIDMIRTIESGLNAGENVMISAPTGSGKTLAALYPVIRYALKNNKRICYLTAKNTQQESVARSLRLLLGNGFPLKTLFLRAREKMCSNETYFCHSDYCAFATDYYNRLQDSGLVDKLTGMNTIFPEDIFTAASAHRLCPAEVQFTLSRQADLVVGDYNYIFDPSTLPQFVFGSSPADWILVIDEAHNLYPRAMELLSPAINYLETNSLYRTVRQKKARVYQKLADILGNIKEILHRKHQDAAVFAPDQRATLIDLDEKVWQTVFDEFEQAYLQYLLHRVRYRQITADDPIEKYYHRFRLFIQVLETYDSKFAPFLSAERGGTLKIQCCEPAGYLGERLDAFHSVIAMSATLDPMTHYANMMGFHENNTRFLQLTYPFQVARRKIVVIPEFDTRLRERHLNYPGYAEIIKNVISLRSGNYIVFFPSFEVLQTTNLYLGTLKIHKLFQRIQMGEKERDEIIDALKENDPPKLLLAVTGGIFAEGIDLPGESCIGVIIFGPSLPPVTPERELIRSYYDRLGEDGFARAYVYPGMLRVIQAAGRLIRSDQDIGVMVLVGDRLADHQFTDLFPEYWGDLTVTADYQSPLLEFWQRFKR